MPTSGDRTRLIADVVTGQVDVWAAARLPEGTDEPESCDYGNALTGGEDMGNGFGIAPEVTA